MALPSKSVESLKVAELKFQSLERKQASLNGTIDLCFMCYFMQVYRVKPNNSLSSDPNQIPKVS